MSDNRTIAAMLTQAQAAARTQQAEPFDAYKTYLDFLALLNATGAAKTKEPHKQPIHGAKAF